MLRWFRRHSAAAPTPERPTPPGLTAIVAGETLIPASAFSRSPPPALFRETLHRHAAFCQALPGEELPLATAGLQRALAILESAPAERSDPSAYGRFADALLHNLDRLGVFEVTLYNASGKPLGLWAPLLGPMTAIPGAAYYHATLRRGDARQREMPVPFAGLGILLVPHVLPPEGLRRWRDGATAHSELREPITIPAPPPQPAAQPMARPPTALAPVADRGESPMLPEHATMPDPHPPAESAGDRESAQTASPAPSPAPAQPAATAHSAPTPRHAPGAAHADALAPAERLRLALQTVFDNPGTLNKRHGLGWLQGETLYAEGKKLAAALRATPPLAERRRALGSNPALYRELVAHRLIEPRADNPTWPVEIRAEGWVERVAAVKIPARVLWSTNIRPESFQGEIVEGGSESLR